MASGYPEVKSEVKRKGSSHVEQNLNPTDRHADTNYDDSQSGGVGSHGGTVLSTGLAVPEIPMPVDEPARPEVIVETFSIPSSPESVKDDISDTQRVTLGSVALERMPARARINLPIDEGSSKPAIDVSHGDLARTTEEVTSALLDASEVTQIYRQGDRAVRLRQNDDGTMSIAPLTPDVLCSIAAENIYFFERKDTGNVRVYPSMKVNKNILAQTDKPFPQIDCVATAPFVTRTGRLAVSNGYYPESNMYLMLKEGEENLQVPDIPTESQIEEAVQLLLGEALGDFPYVDDSDRAHALLFTIAPMMRPMVDGATPMFLINKAAAGTGAGLFLEVQSQVSLGGPVAIMTMGKNDDDIRKSITSKLLTGPREILNDNISRPLDSSSLAAAITARVWEDRVTGTASVPRLSTAAVTWCGTGNNVRTSIENSRRVVQIGLDAKMCQPWRRQHFRHPNLLRWVKENLAQLRLACLTIIRAWISRGCPVAPGQPRLGSIEAWSDIAGGILHGAGVPGFLGNMDRLCQAADPQGSAVSAFATLWWATHGTQPVGVAQLTEQAVEARLDLGQGTDRQVSTRIGIRLRNMAGQLVQTSDGTSLTITPAGEDTGAKLWALIPEGGRPGGAARSTQDGE